MHKWRSSDILDTKFACLWHTGQSLTSTKIALSTVSSVSNRTRLVAQKWSIAWAFQHITRQLFSRWWFKFPRHISNLRVENSVVVDIRTIVWTVWSRVFAVPPCVWCQVQKDAYAQSQIRLISCPCRDTIFKDNPSTDSYKTSTIKWSVGKLAGTYMSCQNTTHPFVICS